MLELVLELVLVLAPVLVLVLVLAQVMVLVRVARDMALPCSNYHILAGMRYENGSPAAPRDIALALRSMCARNVGASFMKK